VQHTGVKTTRAGRRTPARVLLGLAFALLGASASGATVNDRLAEFGAAARQRLTPHFERAGIDYPGRRVALLAFKDSRRLELHSQAANGEWRLLHAYPVQAASGGPGPKLREGDGQVPEGFYRVVFLNANSRYHVSLRLDYPNAFDREMGRADARDRLGGDIMIHGKAVSIGCLAMGDPAAEELFTLAADVGQSNMQVLIAPGDFRRARSTPAAGDPPWVAGLYGRLAEALGAFPLE